jgi:hypothetical protein
MKEAAMRFSLTRTNHRALAVAFNRDKLPKSARKIQRHGIERVVGRVEARDGALHVKSGRVNLTVPAVVEQPGAFAIRDAVLRQLLKSLRDEPAIAVEAGPSGVIINGASIQFSAGDFAFPAPPPEHTAGESGQIGSA